MENCEQLCNGRPAEEEAACMAECQASTIERQPAAVRTYMEVLFCIVVPFFQLLAAALTYTFPIKGERLEANAPETRSYLLTWPSTVAKRITSKSQPQWSD
mmetsp:Transcript_147565/g.471986  ORF Transcript_147565/g.471986 Transcript_147565/m.471986 type:complete len:101 (+) Transcript_147565:1317-1619(+)